MNPHNSSSRILGKEKDQLCDETETDQNYPHTHCTQTDPGYNVKADTQQDARAGEQTKKDSGNPSKKEQGTGSTEKMAGFSVVSLQELKG